MLSRPDLFRVPTPPAFALTVLTVIPKTSDKKALVDGITTSSGSSHTGVNEGLVREDLTLDASNEQQAAANEFTKEVYERINSRGEIFLTSGVVEGMYAIRVVSANPKAEEKYIRKAFDILVRTAEEVLGEDR